MSDNKVKVKCDTCGKEFYKSPNKIMKRNFCSRACVKPVPQAYLKKWSNFNG